MSSLLTWHIFFVLLPFYMKLSNTLIGIQNPASNCSGAYCEAGANFESPDRMRTLSSLPRCRLSQSKGSRFNCVEPPLLDIPASTEILDLIPPPQLHLFLRVGNKTLDAFNERLNEERAFQWVYRNHIVWQGHHGGCLEGSQVKKRLWKPGQLKMALPPRLRKFAIALEQFETDTTSCFRLSWKHLMSKT